ncbi:MAG: hypothetical protein IJ593_04680 [Lachnospiraceae bacterium]|nr:hypothetical protein [Lachnospiraceae bacterium]
MIQVICTDKMVDSKGKIYGYEVEGLGGQKRTVSPENLKNAIKSGQVEVMNMTLTSDNRLVMCGNKRYILDYKTFGKVVESEDEQLVKDSVYKLVSAICKSTNCYKPVFISGYVVNSNEFALDYKVINKWFNGISFKICVSCSRYKLTLQLLAANSDELAETSCNYNITDNKNVNQRITHDCISKFMNDMRLTFKEIDAGRK